MSLADALRAFQATHPAKRLTVAGVPWEYLASGSGDQVILMMHGGTGSFESIFRYSLAFEGDHRVISPTVPTEVTSVAQALAGVTAILDAEGISAAHCIGFSMGGMLQQVLVRQQPERVRSLVLFHCPPPGKAYADQLERRSGRGRALPRWLARPVIRRYLARQFARYPTASDEERAFWTTYYLESSLGDRTRNQLEIVLDYLRHQQFGPDDLANWPGAMLIIETATDEVIPEPERARLKALYPRARVHTFASGGHLGNGVFMFEAAVALMRDFLDVGLAP